MGAETKIEWADHTFNPWIGCAKVSPECDHCYAERGSFRLGAQHRLKLWEGDHYLVKEAYWKQPFAWNRAAQSEGVRKRVFCLSHGDWLEDLRELDALRARLYGIIPETPWLDWLLLTKRPENADRMVPKSWRSAYPPNVWAGVTVGVHESERRLFDLARMPARVRFASCEPLLESVSVAYGPTPDWLIIGGESGPGSRPFELEHARAILREGYRYHLRSFVKQLGARPFNRGRPLKLAHPKGGDMNEWPADLRVRQLPTAA